MSAKRKMKISLQSVVQSQNKPSSRPCVCSMTRNALTLALGIFVKDITHDGPRDGDRSLLVRTRRCVPLFQGCDRSGRTVSLQYLGNDSEDIPIHSTVRTYNDVYSMSQVLSNDDWIQLSGCCLFYHGMTTN